jgi:hypothetical protein
MKAIMRISRRWIMIAAALCLAVGSVLTSAGAASAATGQCAQNSGFAWLGGSEPHCLQATGTYTFSGSQDSFSYLVNNTGFRVWFHQDANGSGWADCFNHGNAYGIANGRDANPGNVQVTNNSSPCSGAGNQGSAFCSTDAPMAFLVVPGECFYSGNTTVTPDNSYVLTNATGDRVWLHQNADGSGWADCFSNDNVYDLTGRDMNPRNVFVSTNSAPC